MKRLLIVPILFLCSCCPQKAYLTAAKANWEVIGPEYRAYVSGDAALTDEVKATRLRTAELFTKLLEEATVEAKK